MQSAIRNEYIGGDTVEHCPLLWLLVWLGVSFGETSRFLALVLSFLEIRLQETWRPSHVENCKERS